MPDSARPILLGSLLKEVSRSFYLTLRVLPAPMGDPVALAYLLARAADTIADTALIAPNARLGLLLSLRAQLSGSPDRAARARLARQAGPLQALAAERRLLESLGAAFDLLACLPAADAQAVRAIVATLSEGMEFDLRTFPNERALRIVALATYDELDRYTYRVAGCVGEFWTRITAAHAPGALLAPLDTMLARGVRFGKALQMTNVLRDCGQDLRIGRCYLPRDMLASFGLTPEDLLAPDASPRARGLRDALLAPALAHFRAALDYTLALSARAPRLRLACVWPIAIGLKTLANLVENDAWLLPGKASKIGRGEVYRQIAWSVPAVASDRLLRGWLESLIAAVERRLKVRAQA